LKVYQVLFLLWVIVFFFWGAKQMSRYNK